MMRSYSKRLVNVRRVTQKNTDKTMPGEERWLMHWPSTPPGKPKQHKESIFPKLTTSYAHAENDRGG
ncbi:MAG: hypothetical protein ACJ795_24705 [Ktedonobacteraceae bacterium]